MEFSSYCVSEVGDDVMRLRSVHSATPDFNSRKLHIRVIFAKYSYTVVFQVSGEAP